MGAQWTLAECLALLYLEVLVITFLMLIQWEDTNGTTQWDKLKTDLQK